MSRYQNFNWTMRREIVVTWLIAAAVVTMLLLLPAHDDSGLDRAMSAVSPAAGVSQPAASEEDPEDADDPNASTCLERDYANERC